MFNKFAIFFGLVVLLNPSSLLARGLLIPEDKRIAPLILIKQIVDFKIEDQIAETMIEQVFYNHSDRPLEATYIFPVPKGASVNKFTMWVDGKETKGELLEANKAREIYTSIVRRIQDPGLLEYMDNNLIKMRVFPVPARGNQRVAVSYTSVVPKEAELMEFVFPLKGEMRSNQVAQDFSLSGTIKSQHGISSTYSPTHEIITQRKSDKEVSLSLSKAGSLGDRDFQLFYSFSDKAVGMSMLTHRPIATEDGYFSLMINPSMKGNKAKPMPRDFVFVMDTSGSMRGPKMDQAKKALRYCINSLGENDRFSMLNFATSVSLFRDEFVAANEEFKNTGRKWIDALDSTGGTAIRDALLAALEIKGNDTSRPLVIIFFTDGMPTIGETNPEKITRDVLAKIKPNIRIFTFGVGDDVNATMLDMLAEKTKAATTYVRPSEDIEIKSSAMVSKISNPVLVNLSLSFSPDIQVLDIYPTSLPDIFEGSQLMVFGKYKGKGGAAIKLRGDLVDEKKEFVYEYNFPEKTSDSKSFVEQLWARRKVGFLLDQIRANGEKGELVDEVTKLAKKYGITTPYTSYLVVPDHVSYPVHRPLPGYPTPKLPPVPFGLMPSSGGEGNRKVLDFARENQSKPGQLAEGRASVAEKASEFAGAAGAPGAEQLKKAMDAKGALDRAKDALRRNDQNAVQGGKLGVDLSVQNQSFRDQTTVSETAIKRISGRSMIEVGGVWIDEGFQKSMPTMVIQAQSDAYFRLLEKQPELRKLFSLGNYLIWVTPGNTALVIDTQEGKSTISDVEIEQMFAPNK
ncbi:MAG: VWA domain-containing protein [Planctomycetes bacterium]|nr:VWA domain-containing protein [Planctomycetota bacterium]NBY03502.1 VWA domain-containing protein [Planctomycetota bacterium]